MDDKRMVRPQSGNNWTQPEDYVAALARKRTARKSRGEADPSKQHEASRFPVHMLPFVALMAVLAVLVIATIFIAFPGNQPELKTGQVASHEQGYAPKGWMKEAEKEFH
jgi:hypothetical protein